HPGLGIWNAAGNVGVGTVNPATKIHMSSGTLTIDGTGGTLTVVGNGSVSGTLTAGTFSGPISGNATTATNLAGGSGGAVPYQSAANTTAFVTGLSGQVLTSAGAGTPTWTTATNANTASSVVQRDASGNFSATSVSLSKAILPGLNAVAFSATPTFDASLGNTQKITLTGNVTLSTLSNATAGQTIAFIICQDVVGGRTFTWPVTVKGATVIGGTLSTCSAQSFIYDGTFAYATAAGVINQ
ncbi:MAG: hypothetical protein KGL74_12145, partial [Elusimicrobia bacterium]|nr:hypothetical protein [Elusimicrobiota bacterium]